MPQSKHKAKEKEDEKEEAKQTTENENEDEIKSKSEVDAFFQSQNSKKDDAQNRELISALNHYGINFKLAQKLIEEFAKELIVRRIWLLRYKQERENIENPAAFLTSIIMNKNGYSDPDAFNIWLKKKLQNKVENDFEILY